VTAAPRHASGGTPLRRSSPRIDVRAARLASGLVLFAFAVSHFTNHALGILSVEAMDAARPWLTSPWFYSPVREALFAAAAVHVGLALWAVYARRRFAAITAAEALQLAFGLAVPILLVQHYVATRVAFERFGVLPFYEYVVAWYWVVSPRDGLIQAALLVAVWVHGCIGLHAWLRLKPWWPRISLLAFALALLGPVLALLGFVVAGRSVLIAAQEPGWLAETLARYRAPDLEASAELAAVVWTWSLAVAAVAAVPFAARLGRSLWERRGGLVPVGYPDGRVVQVPRGATVLDASRAGGVPHAAVCGGRGRCSTCRVRILEGADQLPEPGAEELRVLRRVAAPPNVRLACQLTPLAPVRVAPLLPPTAGAGDGRARAAYLSGQERELAVLFADLRGFTRFSEGRLPYDVVFVLNRYFAATGAAVEAAGGRVDKFIGDGVMALFGIEAGPEAGARQALAAARGMAAGLEELNRALAHELPEPFRIGIGVHLGPVIVGEMGWGRATQLTAIGDAANTASRLEGLTKDFGVQLVASDDLARRAGLADGLFETREVEVRGRTTALRVHLVPSALDLPV
jgi:adenylate cyclase